VELIFEWDKKKEEFNIQKHNVYFEEAKTVFYNSLSKIFDDEIHSIKEKREIIIGHSGKGKLLIVVFTERRKNLIRIISARPATAKERKNYEENVE
jgi:uncharacterized DUF497 family protein